jgi:hypothetical protein
MDDPAAKNISTAFKKAFDRLSKKANLDLKNLWGYDTETHRCYFDGRGIALFPHSTNEKHGSGPPAFTFSIDDDPALLEQVDCELLREAFICSINFKPWDLLDLETNPVNAENWLVIINDEPIDMYAIVVDGWLPSQPFWTLAKVATLPKHCKANVINKAVEKILKDKRYFALCSECSSLFPAGYMHHETCCMGCAQAKYLIVY